MSRRPPVSSKRGQRELKEQLRKLNKRVRNKKYYLNAEYGVKLDLETQGIGDIKSWREFDRYKQRTEQQLKSTPRYIKNSEGIVFRRDIVREIERLEKKVNRQRERDWNSIKDLPYKEPGGRTIGEVQQQRHLGNPKFTRFRKFAFNLNSFYSEGELRKYMDRLKRNDAPLGYTEGDLRMKENYMKSFANVFSLNGDMNNPVFDERQQRIYNHIKNMSMDEFLELFYSETSVGFDYNYDREQEDSKLSELEAVYGLE